MPGSAQLDQNALDDPHEKDGTLVWRFPYQREGTITYGVTHDESLGELQEPSLTVRLSTRENRLVGDTALLKPAPVRASTEGVEAGEPAKIIISGTSLTADGRTPLELDVFIVDEEGNATGDGFITISANAEPVTPDASTDISGHQIKLEDGYARLVLEPALTAFELEVEALTILDGIELTASETLEVTGTRSGMCQAQVSVTGGFDLRGVARGYVESPLGPGTIQAAADVSADLDGIDLDRSLANQPDPADRYPLTGAGTEAAPSLRSADGVAVLYTQPGTSIGYLHAPATVPAVTGLPTTTGLHGHPTVGTNLRVQGFAALLPEGRREAVIIPDGTRRYSIGESIARTSEPITVVEGDTERQVTRHVDYVIDEFLGAITPMQPLWPVTAQFEDVRLVVEYAPEDAARNQIAGGLGLQYRTDQLTVEAGAARQEHLSTAASVKYRAERFEAEARFGLEFQGDGTTHQGRANVTYNLSEDGKLNAEHSSSTGSNATSVRYRHEFNIGAQRSLSAGLGVKYAWEAARISALAEAGSKNGPFGLTLAHEQPFSSDSRATTRAGVSYRLNQNLTARADLQNVWGNEFSGTLGLEQHIGDTQLSLSYELPTASGAGNRARFGVRSPFRLSDRLYLDVHAGLSRSFADSSMETAAGAAVRYRSDGLTATLGAEVAHSAAGFKVVARGGASGQLGPDQTLAIDANYQLAPTFEGRTSVAYALKRSPANFLTYHRMLNSPGRSLIEGEVSATLNFSQRIQLRPSVAYRVFLDDPEGNAYQASLFAIGYLQPELLGRSTTLGIGDGAHALWQPGPASVAYGASVEIQAMVTREIWFGIGYTFANFEGLTPETAGGLYLRLDLVTGAQF